MSSWIYHIRCWSTLTRSTFLGRDGDRFTNGRFFSPDCHLMLVSTILVNLISLYHQFQFWVKWYILENYQLLHEPSGYLPLWILMIAHRLVSFKWDKILYCPFLIVQSVSLMFMLVVCESRFVEFTIAISNYWQSETSNVYTLSVTHNWWHSYARALMLSRV